jgi:hypothetical protein
MRACEDLFGRQVRDVDISVARADSPGEPARPVQQSDLEIGAWAAVAQGREAAP